MWVTGKDSPTLNTIPQKYRHCRNWPLIVKKRLQNRPRKSQKGHEQRCSSYIVSLNLSFHSDVFQPKKLLNLPALIPQLKCHDSTIVTCYYRNRPFMQHCAAFQDTISQSDHDISFSSRTFLIRQGEWVGKKETVIWSVICWWQKYCSWPWCSISCVKFWKFKQEILNFNIGHYNLI